MNLIIPDHLLPNLFVFCVRSQAFDRDGNGALDVSDLADLLGVLKGIAGWPPSAGSGMGTSTGAAATGLGLEAAMDAMYEDHSGQVTLPAPIWAPTNAKRQAVRSNAKV